MDKIIKYLFLFSFNIFNLAAFNTITELKEYAKSVDELPEIDNTNLLNPDYTTFHKTMLKSPGVLGRIGSFLGLKKISNIERLEQFKTLLEKVIKKRELSSFTSSFIQAFTPLANSKIVVFGDIQGAFHSLVRDLEELKRQGIISEDLVVSKDCYIVFNGDFIDRSPFNLESLTLMLKLLELNQDRIFYIKGNHEDNDYWENFDLKRELEVKLGHLSTFKRLFDRFFETLPISIYLKSGKQKDASFVKIYHYISPDSSVISNFLINNDSNVPKIFKLVNQTPSNMLIDIKAVIAGVSRSTIYQPTPGLSLLSSEKGATTWTLLSSPTRTYQKLYDFHNDAFSIIDVKASLDNWTITLFFQDTRDMQGFSNVIYNFVTSQKIVKKNEVTQVVESKKEELLSTIKKLKETIKVLEGDLKPEAAAEEISKREIVFGSTFWLSGGSDDVFRLSYKGLTLAINKINREGGINGKRLKVIFLDDEYSPDKAKKNIETFLEKYKTNLIFSPIGSPSLSGYLDMIKEKKVLVLFPITGSDDFRIPEDHLVFFRIPYSSEARVLTEYAIKDRQINKFAIFYQNDSFGISSFETAKKVFKENNIKDWLELPYQRKTSDFSIEAKKIIEYNPQAILFFSTDKPAVSFIRQIEAINLSGKLLFCISILAIKWFKDFINNLGISLINTQIIPDLKTNKFPIVEEFRTEANAYDLSIDPFTFEGYINASLIIDILKKVKGDITAEKIIEVINGIKNYNYKGFDLNLDPKTRGLLKTLWIETEKGVWLERTIKEDVPSVAQENPSEAPKPAEVKVEEEKVKKVEVAIPVKKVKPTSMVISNGEIVLGSTLWFSRTDDIFTLLRKGLSLRINKVNREGGINGKRLKVIFLDDEYSPDKARSNVKTFLEKYKTNVIFSPIGSPTLLSYFDLVKNKEVFVLFPLTGAEEFRVPEEYLVHLRVSYVDEARTLTEYAIKERDIEKLVIFYQNDSYGKTCLNSAVKVLKENNIKDWLEVPYQRKAVEFSAEAKKIIAYNAQAILLFSTDKSAAGLIRKLEAKNLSGKFLFGVSDLSVNWFKDFVKELGLSLILTRIMPDIKISTLPIVEEFKAEAIAQALLLDPFVLEGYIQADVAIDILKKVKGEITAEKISEVINGIKNYNYKGLILDIDPKTRGLLKTLWIETEKGLWLERNLNKVVTASAEKKQLEVK